MGRSRTASVIEPAPVAAPRPPLTPIPGASGRTPAPRRKIAWHTRLLRDRALLLMAAPGLILLLLFQYLPLAGNVIAFQDYLPFLPLGQSPWVGLDNFAVIINVDPAFLNALRNTLVQVVLVFSAPIALALLMNIMLSERLKRLVQSVLYLPHFLS